MAYIFHDLSQYKIEINNSVNILLVLRVDKYGLSIQYISIHLSILPPGPGWIDGWINMVTLEYRDLNLLNLTGYYYSNNTFY